MSFAVGDHVVLPPHGAGTVVGVEDSGNGTQISIRMHFSKMTMMVPEAIASERGVRPAITAKQAASVLKELSKEGSEMHEKPLERSKETAAQIRKGSVEDLVNVLRDYTLRKQSGKNRSAVEQKAFDTARQALLSEIALAKDISEAEAGELIDKALGTDTPTT